MHIHYPAALIWLASLTPALGGEIKWPNTNIPVPPEVQGYIISECQRYVGYSEETVDACIRRERYGYRAVVTLLTDPEDGDLFAERYRKCVVGLGDLGGRFHRRRAECMSAVDKIVWRFEYTQEASGARRIVIADAD